MIILSVGHVFIHKKKLKDESARMKQKEYVRGYNEILQNNDKLCKKLKLKGPNM